MPNDVYLQPDAPDPIHSDKIILGIVRDYVPDARAVTGVDESGGEARTYAVDEGLIVKVQRPQQLRPRTSLEKEAVFLNHLRCDPQISVPQVLGYGREGDIEFTVMTRIPGVAVINTVLAGKARQQALYALGQTLRRIHSIPQEPLVTTRLFPGDADFDDVAERFEETLTGLIARIKDRAVPWGLKWTVEQVVDKAIAALPQSDQRVALHSNPGRTHTFVEATTGRFTGLIDFGDAYISHPAWDLWRWNLPEDRKAVLSGYTADRSVGPEFLQTWRVVMVLSDLVAVAYQSDAWEASRDDLRQLMETW
ncbi:MAG: aminoglycoside phosphotransferase family protein [Firmicutes bacterium]|nr:aminoglycoside phosphotransferase family protein [Bacillota bacterium]